MARHMWTVVCQAIITDQVTNGVSYIQSIEGLTVSNFPAATQLAVGTLWHREGDEVAITARARILSPDGAVAAEVSQPPRPLGAAARLRQNSFFGGFPITAAGEYLVVVEQQRNGEWVREFSMPLPVQLVAPAEMQRIVQERMATAR
jgi:hypothetical protein